MNKLNWWIMGYQFPMTKCLLVFKIFPIFNFSEVDSREKRFSLYRLFLAQVKIWQFFLFFPILWIYYCHCNTKVPVKKYYSSLTEVPLFFFFPLLTIFLTAFNDLSLSLTFLTIMFLGVGFFGFIDFENSCAFWIWMSVFFPALFSHFFIQRIFQLLFFSIFLLKDNCFRIFCCFQTSAWIS